MNWTRNYLLMIGNDKCLIPKVNNTDICFIWSFRLVSFMGFILYSAVGWIPAKDRDSSREILVFRFSEMKPASYDGVRARSKLQLGLGRCFFYYVYWEQRFWTDLLLEWCGNWHESILFMTGPMFGLINSDIMSKVFEGQRGNTQCNVIGIRGTLWVKAL